MEQQLSAFLAAAQNDARINSLHISLYVALLFYWQKSRYENPLMVVSRDIMDMAKISGRATYYRIIRELHDYKYIRYLPSYNHFLGSLVYFLEITG